MKYPCLTTSYVIFDDIRTAKLKRVEWVIEMYKSFLSGYHAAGPMPRAEIVANDALETVRAILAEVGG